MGLVSWVWWPSEHFHTMFQEVGKVISMLGIELATFEVEDQLFNHYSMVASAVVKTSNHSYARQSSNLQTQRHCVRMSVVLKNTMPTRVNLLVPENLLRTPKMCMSSGHFCYIEYYSVNFSSSQYCWGIQCTQCNL